MSSKNTNQMSLVKNLEQGLREEEEFDYVVVQGKSNVEKEDNVEALFLQMMLTESKENRDARQCCLFQDSDEQRLQQGKALEKDKCDKTEQRSQEQLQHTLPPSGFDFRHLMLLRDIPISSFYGLDIDNLSLPIQPLSNVGSFHGFDEESLAAENAALDEFYAKLRSKKAGCKNDQSSGNKCTQDQSQNFLCPDSTTEEDDDIRTMRNLLAYKLYHGPVPNFLDQPATTFGPNHPLLVYMQYELPKGECISGSWLMDKLIKLQSKYKKIVAEKGKTPEHQDFPTPGEYTLFRLSRLTWERDQE